MWQPIGLVISTAAVFGGLFMMARPTAMIRQDPDYLQNSTPQRARRTVRVSGVVLLLMGLAGLYAILFERGPVDPVGF